MSVDPSDEPALDAADELLPEYQFDYAKARPNRFAESRPPGGLLVVLEPDIARVFTTAESVNAVLRALITTMPPAALRSAESSPTRMPFDDPDHPTAAEGTPIDVGRVRR